MVKAIKFKSIFYSKKGTLESKKILFIQNTNIFEFKTY